MNAQLNSQHDKQAVYTLPETRITISLWLYGCKWYVRRVVTSNDKNYSRCLDWTMLYDGKDYDDALKVYNQACASQSFLPDHCTSESGQMFILYLLAIVAIAFCLYIAYIGLSQLAGCTSGGGIFESMLSRLGEVLR